MQKRFLFILSALMFMAFVLPMGSSVQCNATATTINLSSVSLGCTLDSSQNYTFQQGFYYFNSSSNSDVPVINITAHNIVLDLNGSELIGNYTGVLEQEVDNGSRIGIYVTTGANFTLKNGLIKGYRYGFTHLNSGGRNFFNILNMTFVNNSQGVRLLRDSNKVFNSTFIGSWNDGIFAEGFSADHNRFEYNNFIGGADGIHISSTGYNSENNTVIYNNFSNSYNKFGVYLERTFSNNISYNNFYNMISNIGSGGSINNTYFAFNIMQNMSNQTSQNCDSCKGFDFFINSGLLHINDNYFLNNTISNGLTGFSIPNSTRNLFINNNLVNLSLYGFSITTENYNNISYNTFTNISSVLRNAGLISPFGGFSIFKFNILLDNQVILESSSGTNRPSYLEYDNEYRTSLFLNQSGAGNSTFNLYSLTNSLIYFSNGSVACSDIATCDNNINITLTPNNYSYVLDNFNLTEGVTRQFSPLSISGTSTSKTITSSLSDSITATVVVNVAQCSFSATYQGNGVNEDSCSDNVATFTLTDIPAGASELALQYLDINCSSNTGASIIIILVFCALAIVSLTFIIVVKFREGELDVKLLIIVFIAIIVGLVLFTQVAQITGGVCN